MTVDIRIDKLTDCLVNRITGEIKETEYSEVFWDDGIK